jgi:hypothetical protein
VPKATTIKAIFACRNQGEGKEHDGGNGDGLGLVEHLPANLIAEIVGSRRPGDELYRRPSKRSTQAPV